MYGISASSVWKSVDEVTRALQKIMGHIIRWVAVEEFELIEKQFRSRAGVPGVIGTIVGCQIKLTAPEETQKDYLYRKFFSSLNLLAVALPDKSSSYVNIGTVS